MANLKHIKFWIPTSFTNLLLDTCAIVILVSALIAALPAAVGAAGRTPDLFATEASKISPAMECAASEVGRMMVCIVNTTDREADKMAMGMIKLARKYDFALKGWTLMLITSRDYVVTLPFQN